MLLRDVFSILRSDPGGPEPLGASFQDMLKRSAELTATAGRIYFEGVSDDGELDRIAKDDVRINKLQRKIRKRVLVHLSTQSNAPDLPHCLVLFSTVKDVERIGDYAKDLAHSASYHGGTLPSDPFVDDLRALASEIGDQLAATVVTFESSDEGAARAAIPLGKNLLARCEELTARTAKLHCEPAVHTALVLATQYYQRICGHTLNVLSSLVVPLHRLDYYDEKDMLSTVSG